MRVAAAADGVALTARVPGVVAAAVASTANVSGALRGCLHEVRAARKKCRVHVREATCTQLNSTQLNSTAVTRCLAHTSPTAHPDPFAALAQAAAPPQRRRRCAELTGRGGRL